jgi:hypothetical protein
MSHKSFNPGFPVLIYEEGMELPKTGIYYLGLWQWTVAAQGHWPRQRLCACGQHLRPPRVRG